MGKYILSLLMVLLFFGCKDESTNITPIQEGVQSDIAWGSLANSPAPVYHIDMQSTGRSKYSGPTNGTVIDSIPLDNNQSGIVIGKDKEWYFCDRYYIYSFKDSVKWKQLIDMEITSTPVALADGSILAIGSSVRSIIKFNSFGDTIWHYQNSSQIWNLAIGVDKSGNIYFVDAGRNLKCLSSSGQNLWSINDSKFFGGGDQVLSFSADGKTLYGINPQQGVFAVDVVNKSLKWFYESPKQFSGISVDSYGNLYFIKEDTVLNTGASVNSLVCLNSIGAVKFKHTFYSKYSLMDNVEQAIDVNGNLYFGGDTLIAINYKGELKWKLPLPGLIHTSIICDKNSNVYFGCYGEASSENYIFCVNSNGQKIFQTKILGRGFSANPVITEDGKLLIPEFRNNKYLYVIK